jgi:hypothetical protein
MNSYKVEQTDKPQVTDDAQTFEAEDHEHAAELWLMSPAL